MQTKGVLGQLIKDLCYLPGVGAKTAQRMTFYLLQHDRKSARRLAETILAAIDTIVYCRQCRTFTENELCEMCSNKQRDTSRICVVENPADVWSIEQARVFNGLFFVLHGRLSPLDGIGPEELGLEQLEQKLASGHIKELILATNSTVEGEATAYYLSDLAQQHHVHASRIAHGVPMGGELEYIDSGTLAHAFNGRTKI